MAVKPREWGFWRKIGRLFRLRLVIPVKRSRHPPEYTARGVAIGLAWGLTPLVGIQMYIVLANWLLLKPFKRFDFNLIVGMAWVWVTNVFTMLPIYYAFYVTGQIMLGHWGDITGWDAFVGTWRDIVLNGEGNVWEALLTYITRVAKQEWEPLVLGCLPYMAVGGWLGYVWSLKYVTRRRERIRLRAEERAAQHAAAFATQGHPES